MSGVLDHVLTLDPVWILVVVGLLVFAEDAIFIGFLIPGETAAVIAGVSAGIDHLALPISLAVVIVAAILGDSVGYEVGRHFFGPKVLTNRLLIPHRHRIERAQDFLRRRGGIAVFLGRFTAFFRAMMPALAGAAHMPYRTFLAWNAFGGVIWGSVFVSLGYAAGMSYHQLEHQVGRGVAIGVAVIVVGLLLFLKFRPKHDE